MKVLSVLLSAVLLGLSPGFGCHEALAAALRGGGARSSFRTVAVNAPVSGKIIPGQLLDGSSGIFPSQSKLPLTTKAALKIPVPPRLTLQGVPYQAERISGELSRDLMPLLEGYGPQGPQTSEDGRGLGVKLEEVMTGGKSLGEGTPVEGKESQGGSGTGLSAPPEASQGKDGSGQEPPKPRASHWERFGKTPLWLKLILGLAVLAVGIDYAHYRANAKPWHSYPFRTAPRILAAKPYYELDSKERHERFMRFEVAWEPRIYAGDKAMEEGRFADAEGHYKSALHEAESLLGSDDIMVAVGLWRLASVYEEMGKWAKAERCYREIIAIDEKEIGSPHGSRASQYPDLSSALYRLAIALASQERFAEAEPLLLKALRITQEAKARGQSEWTQREADDFLRRLRSWLAWVYWAQGRYAEAESLYRQLLAEYRVLGGTESHFAALHELYLARVLKDTGKTEEASSLEAHARSVLKPYTRKEKK